MPLIIGIKFNNTGKQYYFGPKSYEFKVGDGAIVETVRGLEYAIVSQKNTEVPENEIIAPLKDVVRKADEKDVKQAEENVKRAANALRVCQEKVEKHKLQMKLINAEYTFDRSKVIFNFTADGRVDFRELVKDLASELRMRIELRQVYEKDDIKLRGAMGQCGRECCCITCSNVCDKSTVKMAKNQNISLNPTKVSGMCGKLMCCLRFENDFYVEVGKQMPKINAVVSTPDGQGHVFKVDILREKITVGIEKDDTITEHEYKLGEFKILGAPNDKNRDNDDVDPATEAELKKLED